MNRIREIEKNKLLDVISITDHNIIDMELYDRVVSTLENTTVFPGFEINLELQDYLKGDYGIALDRNRSYFHAIVILHPNDAIKARDLLEKLFGKKNDGEDSYCYLPFLIKINIFFFIINDYKNSEYLLFL